MNTFLKVIGIVVVVAVVAAAAFVAYFYFTVCGHTHGVIC